MRGISDAAEAEARRAQGRLAKSVAELAQRLVVQINMATLLPMGLGVLVCLLAFGSLSMWASFSIGSRQSHDLFWILHMPSGLLMGGLALIRGLFWGVHAVRDFAKGHVRWRRHTLPALIFLLLGRWLVSLTSF